MPTASLAGLALVAFAISFFVSTPIVMAQEACQGVGAKVCDVSSGKCIDTMTDPQNCGGCGAVCGSPEACTAACGSNQACLSSCYANQTCVAGSCKPQISQGSGSSGVFACHFTTGKLSGTTDVPRLSGPVNAPCYDDYGSSGTQVTAVFACQFSQGLLSGQTLVPSGMALFGPVGQSCTDNYGSSGNQVISP